MNIVFTMCFTGSCLFVLYLIVLLFFGKFFDSIWNYNILRLVLLFFVTPLGLLKNLFNQSLASPDFQLRNVFPVLITTPDGVYANIVFRTNTIIVICWLVIASGTFIWQQMKYIRLKKMIMVSMTEIIEPELLDYIDTCRRNMGIKRRVQVYQSEFISPFTTGVCHPIIALSASLPLEKQKIIVRHELLHIKRCDIVFLLLRRLVLCFYWFNPLVYILDVQLEKNVETSCDKSVILDMGQEERYDYARLIIEMASYDIQYRRAYLSSFSRSMKDMKERIDIIMKSEKEYRKGLSIIVAVFMTLFSSFTAFAYQPTTKFSMNWDTSITSLPGLDSSDGMSFESGQFSAGQAFYSIRYDSQFTDINGNVYEIDDFPDSNYAACEHDFVDGTYSMHSTKADGSCVTKYYEAQRCIKCGHLEIGLYLDTETHVICPHK